MDLITQRLNLRASRTLKTTTVTVCDVTAARGRPYRTYRIRLADRRQLCGLYPAWLVWQAWLSAQCICTDLKWRRWAARASTATSPASSSCRNCSSSHLSWRRVTHVTPHTIPVHWPLASTAAACHGRLRPCLRQIILDCYVYLLLMTIF